jgi:hypothetical protein
MRLRAERIEHIRPGKSHSRGGRRSPLPQFPPLRTGDSSLQRKDKGSLSRFVQHPDYAGEGGLTACYRGQHERRNRCKAIHKRAHGGVPPSDDDAKTLTHLAGRSHRLCFEERPPLEVRRKRPFPRFLFLIFETFLTFPPVPYRFGAISVPTRIDLMCPAILPYIINTTAIHTGTRASLHEENVKESDDEDQSRGGA